uniref:DUF772 domain-containing protein n=1 Tax=Ascaris lumbricoides TaxID=6252 RepID=A0A0M3IC27_ASCLU
MVAFFREPEPMVIASALYRKRFRPSSILEAIATKRCQQVETLVTRCVALGPQRAFNKEEEMRDNKLVQSNMDRSGRFDKFLALSND